MSFLELLNLWPPFEPGADAPTVAADLRRAVFAALRADAGLAAVVSTRVYHGIATDTIALGATAVTYQVTAQDRPADLARPLTIVPARVRVTCFGQVLADVIAAVERVRQIFHGFTGSLGGLITVVECRVANEVDTPVPPRDGGSKWTYRTVIDVAVRYREALPDRFP